MQMKSDFSIIQEELIDSVQRLKQIVTESNEWEIKLQLLRDEKASLENARIEENNKMNYLKSAPARNIPLPHMRTNCQE